MPHQMLQGGEGDAVAYHVSSKGVSQPVWIGVGDLAAPAMMAEQRAEPNGRHGPTPAAAFQGNEQGGGVGERSFQAQIFFQDLDNFLRQRQDALRVSFSV